MPSRDKRDRLTFDVGGLRERLQQYAIEPNQSLASIVRMALMEWLDWKEGKLLRPAVRSDVNAIASQSIRSLISDRDLEVLSVETKLPQQRLAQLRDGDCPTDIELTLLEKGLGVSLEQLVELRRRTLSSNGREINGA